MSSIESPRYPRCILGTVCVPWTQQYELEENIFRDSIRALRKQGLDNLYLFGTAGEGYAVTDSQHDRIVEIFCEEMRGGPAQPMVGLISLSLPVMIERIERGVEMGVHEYQISLPSWGKLSDTELFTFFREVCGRFPQCRFLHYNLLRAGRLVTAKEYARLAEEHPNLVATKHGTSDSALVHDLLINAPQLRHFLTEPSYAYGSLLGEPGFLISVASIHPGRAREYFQAGVDRDVEKLTALQKEVMAIRSQLLTAVGGSAHMDGAYDKIFCRIHDENFPLSLLPPYNGAPLQAFETFRDYVRQHYPQWCLS